MFTFAQPDNFINGVNRYVIGAQIADSTLYKLIISFKIMMNIVGLFLIFCEYRRKIKSQFIIHPNIVVILNCIRIFSFMFLVAYLAINSHDLYRYMKPVEDQSERMLKTTVLVTLRLCTTVPTVGMLIALVILALEQIISTIALSDYEDVKRPRCIIGTTILLTTLASFISFCMLYTDTDFNSYNFLSSSRNERNKEGYTAFLVVLLILTFTVFCLCITIKAWNTHLFVSVRRKILRSNQVRRQLSIKYQINENIKVAKLFIPISFGTFLLYSINIFGTMIAHQIITDALLRLCVNEAVFLQSWSAHVFSICSLYQMGEIPFTQPYILRKKAKPIEKESHKQFVERQKAMFEGPPDPQPLVYVPATSKTHLPGLCSVRNIKIHDSSLLKIF